MRPLKLLLVDDEKDLREALSEFLSESGIEVFVAEDGQNALDFLNENTVDVVLSDVQMPRLNGMEFLNIVNQKFSHRPSIYIYTGQSHFSKNDFLNNGARGYFEKPIDLDYLVAVLKNDVKHL